MADKNEMFPDISGVFHIDESKIPKTLIEKPAEPAKKNAPTESVLLSSPEKKIAELRKERMDRSRAVQHRRAVKKKAQLRGLAVFCAGTLVLALLVGLIWGAVARSKRPTVRLAEAAKEDLVSYYTTDAVIYIRTDPETYAAEYYAICIADDDESLLKGKENASAEIILPDKTVLKGLFRFVDLRYDDSDEIRLIKNALPEDKNYENVSNFAVAFVGITDTLPLVEGTVAELRITLDYKKDALTVPEGAVFTDQDGSSYVWLYRSFGKKLIKTPVKAGSSANGSVAIESGLREGDRVVCEILTEDAVLEDKIKVKLASDGETAAAGKSGKEEKTDG